MAELLTKRWVYKVSGESTKATIPSIAQNLCSFLLSYTATLNSGNTGAPGSRRAGEAFLLDFVVVMNAKIKDAVGAVFILWTMSQLPPVPVLGSAAVVEAVCSLVTAAQNSANREIHIASQLYAIDIVTKNVTVENCAVGLLGIGRFLAVLKARDVESEIPRVVAWLTSAFGDAVYAATASLVAGILKGEPPDPVAVTAVARLVNVLSATQGHTDCLAPLTQLFAAISTSP